jgi:hypothetical protein
MVMDPQDLQSKNNSGANPLDTANSNENASERIFDISADNISPIEEPVDSIKRSSPPPEIDLLDKKIGTFDTTPFASPIKKSTPPQTSIQTSITPRTPTPSSTTTAGLVQSRTFTPSPTSQISAQPVPMATPKIAPSSESTRSSINILAQEQSKKTSGTLTARSLQDEVTSALPANLRPREVKPQIPATPLNTPDDTSLPAKSSQSRLIIDGIATRPMQIAKPVRTYEGDVAEVMLHKRTSSASIAIAESKRQEGTESIGSENGGEPNHISKKIVMLVLALILLGSGAYGAYYLYSKSALAPTTPIAQPQKVAPGIISKDSQIVVTIDGQNTLSARQRIINEVKKIQPPNTVKEFIVATKNGIGVLTRVPAQDMITLLDINAPDILTRSLTEDWMLGVYSDSGGNQSVFVVATTNFFQNTFAGMLQWERIMADDLKQYLYPDTVEGVANESNQTKPSQSPDSLNNIDSILPSTGTTTATSSLSRQTSVHATSTPFATSSRIESVAPLKQYVTIRGKFEDRIIKNKDVRAFRIDNGEITFLYSFINNTHLVVTDKESTLIEILNRLEKQSFIR